MRILFFLCLIGSVGMLYAQNPAPAPDDSVHFSASVGFSVNGTEEYATGSYVLWRKTGNGPTNQITKPIIICEGIDFFEGVVTAATWPSDVYTIFNSNRSRKLADNLRAEGFDLIILNYDDSGDYLQKNAFLLAELIDRINTLKVGIAPNIVVGVSMGGVVARYGLSYMEANGLPHETGMFVSFDSPQKGAYFPICMQHWAVAASGGLINLLGSLQGINSWDATSSKQMLMFHRLQSGNPGHANPDPMFHQFYQELEGLNANDGYPELCRNIAVSNGNKTGILQESILDSTGLGSGNPANGFGFEYTIGSSAGTYQGYITRFLPESEIPNTIYVGGPYQMYHHAFIVTGYADRWGYGANQEYDLAPGGYIDWYRIMGVAAKQIDSSGIVAVNTPNIEFISTRSALGLDTTDLAATIDGDPNHQLEMPFEAYYAPLQENQYHASLPTETASWLLDQALSLHQGGEVILDGSGDSFNFAVNTNNIIFNSYSVQNGATFGVNVVGRSDYSNKFPSAPSTPFGSHFSASTGLNEGIKISIESGSNLVLGHTFGRTATLIIHEGSTLDLGPNSTLRIHAGSTLVIEPGATLRISPGTNIELLGDDSILEIKGNLELESGAIFGFSGLGFIRLGLPYLPASSYANVHLIGNGPHGIDLSGGGPSDKILEIMPGTYLGPEYGLDAFSIEQGRVEMGAGSHLNTGYADLTLRDAVITASNPDAPFNTIFGNGQLLHDIRNITVSYADKGISWRGFLGDNSSIEINDSNFDDCRIGLNTKGRSANLVGVNFFDCENGWVGNNHSGAGSFENGIIEVLYGYGIFQQGSGQISVKEADISGGLIGVFNQGTGSTSLTCSEIHTTTAGIHQALGGWVALNNQRDNMLKGTWAGIALNDSWYPLLYQGNNRLIPENGGIDITGTIFYPALVLQANNNQWNSNIPNPIPAGPNPGTSPTSPADYVLSSPQGAVTISDPGPTAWQACGSGNTGISADWVAACSECPTIATSSYNNVRLDLAINDAMNLLYDSNHEYQAPVAAAYRFHEILTVGYSYTASVTSLLDMVAFRFREAVEAGIAMDSIDTNPAIHSPSLSGLPGLLSDALGIWIAECENQDRDLPAFYLSADQALIWDWVGQPSQASSDLQDLRSEATGDNLTWLDNWTCYLDIRDDILNNQITPEVADSLLDLCVALPAPNLSGSNNARFGLFPEVGEGNNGPSYRAYPNPAEGRLLVEGSLSTERSVSIRLLSMAGQAIELMPGTEVAAGDHVWKLSLDGIPAGMYILEVHSDRQSWREKIVVR